ncbi:hypothetical protein QQZ08_005491 [Neonectria magnoliae]|uniref:DUF899-domain-containing protein n=1 Tax=Neonectria magnoliae TaxID=2732573 RepID=A0ABR1I4V9_9HYPO
MLSKIVTRDEWLAAQKALLVKEKELTRANDALSAQRRHLPMVKVDKTYTFKGPSNTTVTLSDLFDGCDQLIIYHFMFKPGDDEGCRGCSHIGESLPDVRHLRLKNTNLVCVSRGDVDKLEAFRQKNGWAWPWYSSGESDFNYDFYATVDEAVCPMLLNFRSKEEMEAEGKSWYTGDVPGFSVFLKKDGDIFHTYSTFARGGEKTMPTLALLDMSPLGRQTGQYGPAEFKLKYEYD